MNLPTREHCFELFKEYHTPNNVIAHCKMASKCAVALARKLIGKGVDVNVELVERASLLHDLLRVCDFRNFERDSLNVSDEEYNALKNIRKKFKDKSHEEACCGILRNKYPELALTVKRHHIDYMLSKDNKPKTWEEKLVHYADKRVMHDKIVSLKERFEDGKKRNMLIINKNLTKRALAEKQIYKLEEELFNKIEFSPAMLETLI